jgi:hypothetical protein
MRLIAYFLTGIIILCAPQALYAQEGHSRPVLRMGRMEVHPRASVTETFSDNIYAISEKTSDLITKISPGVKLLFPFREESSIYFDYSFDDYYYKDLGKNYFKNNVVISADLEFRNFYFRGKDAYNQRVDITSSQRFTEYDINTFDFLLGKKIRRVGAEISDSLKTTRYKKPDEAYDYDENLLSLVAYYSIFSKTDILLEVGMGDVSYKTDTSRDSEYQDLLVGIRGNPTPRMHIVCKGGMQSRDYTDESKRDWEAVILTLNLTEDLTEKTQLVIGLERWPYEASFVEDNYYYNSDKVSVGINYRPGRKILIDISAAYNVRDYTKVSDRKDTLIQGGIGISFIPREWFTSRLSYRYDTQDSNDANSTYEANTVSLTGRMEF